MLFPRYSLRASLLVVSCCAIYFLILGEANRDQAWAVVVAVTVLSLGVLLLFHAIVYLLAVGISQLFTAQQSPARTSRGGVQSTPDQQFPPSSGSAD